MAVPIIALPCGSCSTPGAPRDLTFSFIAPPVSSPSLWQLHRANFQVFTNTHLCGTYTATNAPADTTGTALGTACSSQVLQTVALIAFRDRLTAGQAAVSTWNMANNILVREARAPPPPGCKAVQGPRCTLCS